MNKHRREGNFSIVLQHYLQYLIRLSTKLLERKFSNMLTAKNCQVNLALKTLPLISHLASYSSFNWSYQNIFLLFLEFLISRLCSVRAQDFNLVLFMGQRLDTHAKCCVWLGVRNTDEWGIIDGLHVKL